jgi:hypothetical protein
VQNLKSQFHEKFHEEINNPHPVMIKIPASADEGVFYGQ